MTKEEMLSAIYDEMSDKTLSYGCIVKTSDWIMRTIWTCSIISNTIYFNWCWCCEESDEAWEYTIIWHPVRIGDVLDWFDKWLEIFLDVNNDKWHDIYKDIIALWQNKRLPIDEQSDECIEFVYNLIKK